MLYINIINKLLTLRVFHQDYTHLIVVMQDNTFYYF